MIPSSLRPIAKAVVAAVLPLLALAVQLTVIDSTTAAEVTTAILAAASFVGVHQTENRPTS